MGSSLFQGERLPKEEALFRKAVRARQGSNPGLALRSDWSSVLGLLCGQLARQGDLYAHPATWTLMVTQPPPGYPRGFAFRPYARKSSPTPD